MSDNQALLAALKSPTAASWATLTRLLHRWPDPAEAVARCRALQQWPKTLQRTPLRSWLQPQLDGQPPHPLMSLCLAPGGWLLSVAVSLGPLSDSGRWMLLSLIHI